MDCDRYEDTTNINFDRKRGFLLNVTNEENVIWITVNHISEFVI